MQKIQVFLRQLQREYQHMVQSERFGLERVTGVDEVEAMRDEVSLRLKTKDQNRNKDLNYTTLCLANFYILQRR